MYKRQVEEINTKNLRDLESFVTQETQLFHDSIKNNLRIAKPVSYTHLDVYKRQGLVRDIFYYAVETALFFTKRLDYANRNIVFINEWR